MRTESVKQGCLIFLLACFLQGCGNSSSSSYSNETDESSFAEMLYDDGRGGPEEVFADENEDETEYAVEDDESDFQMTGIMETCRHCNGYGIVQDGLYGVAHYCMFCGGLRVVDAAINTLPDDIFEQVTSSSTYKDGIDREQIVREIEWLEEDISQMEHQLEYIESDMQRSYLQQQIISARYEVKRLHRILNG